MVSLEGLITNRAVPAADVVVAFGLPYKLLRFGTSYCDSVYAMSSWSALHSRFKNVIGQRDASSLREDRAAT